MRTKQPGGVSKVALRATRVLAGVQAVLVLAQGALAGSHLTGNAGALDAHRLLGTVVLSVLGLTTAIAAAIALPRNRWAFPVTGLAFIGLWAQIDFGFLDQLDLHLPLGIALFGTYLALALVLRDRSESLTKEKQ